VIRQAISCDICGRDEQQTNHWFGVHEYGPELRISGWSSQARMSSKPSTSADKPVCTSSSTTT